MKTSVGISLLVVGLVLGIGASAILSIGSVVTPKVTETSFEIVLSTVVVTSTSTMEETLGATASTPYPPVSQSSSQVSPSSSVSSLSVNSAGNVTISGLVTVSSGGTPYKITLTEASGTVITIPPTGGGGEIEASVPNNETYTVEIYFQTITGGYGSCSAQQLFVYSPTPVLAVEISC